MVSSTERPRGSPNGSCRCLRPARFMVGEWEVAMRTLHVSLIVVALLLGLAVAVAGQSDEECVDERCVLGEFTGRLVFGPMCEGVDPNGLTCDTPAVLEAFSDARLDGEVAITGWSREIGETSVLWLGSWLIGDSADGWVEVASPRLQHRDGAPTQYTSVLVGTGANEGLSAVAEVTVTGSVFDFHGRIVPGSMQAGVPDFAGVIRTGDRAELDW